MTLAIVHVVRQYAPSIGGLESVVARLASEQKHRLGHDVRVITLDRVFATPGSRLPARETVDGIPVTRLAWAGSPRYPLCPQVLAHLGEADLVHVHGIDFFFDWLAITRLLHGRPLVASTHGGFFHTAFASTLKRLWFRTITRWSARGYGRLVATSENDGAVFERIAADRVTVAENGADVDRFRDRASSANGRTLLYFGRWSSNKGIAELVALVATLRARDDRWRLIVAGRPFDLTVEDLQRLAERHALEGALELHPSPSDDALAALMSRSDYFACLSRHEGFGIAAIEAMSAGLYPLLSDIPPFRKLVADSRTGLLFRKDDSIEVQANQVVAAHERSGDRTLERQHMMAFTRRYDWPLVVDRYEAVYQGVLATRGRRTESRAVPR